MKGQRSTVSKYEDLDHKIGYYRDVESMKIEPSEIHREVPFGKVTFGYATMVQVLNFKYD